MLAAILILAQLIGPVAPLLSHAPSAATQAAGRCCCCAAGSCTCGCSRSSDTSGSQDEDESPKARICGCDDTPLALPATPTTAPHRLDLAGATRTPIDHAAAADLCRFASDHLAHGPPTGQPNLGTVVLLI